jgi:hypothetical protein
MRAIQSRSWPSASANLEYAAVWGTRDMVLVTSQRISDGVPAARISTLLDPVGKVDGNPVRLKRNKDIAFVGCKPYGMGFVLAPEEAMEWIAADPRNADVIFPYLNWEDLNSRPDASAPRWIIDFNDRSEEQAETYSLPYRRVLEKVRPERMNNNRKARRERWWQFAELAPALRKAIADLDEVLAIAQVSKTVMPGRVPTGRVFDQKLIVFATDSYATQAVLSSSLHQMWAIKYTSTMRTDVNYSPSDVFLTFSRPAAGDQLAEVGRTLVAERRKITLDRELGLTKLYNLVNDPNYTDDDIDRMRQIHVELDHYVMDAYGWDDVPLDHGFHTYRQMQRWTVSPAARVEILDRLLEENLRRAAAQGEAPPAAEDEDEGDDE